ncbi:Flp family type IVb pilin [Roseibium marinum]
MRDETGATAIEYTLIAAIIGTVIIVSFGAIGETLRDDVFGAVVEALNGVLGGGGEEAGGEDAT